MRESNDFIKDRTTQTISAAKTLAPQWTFQQKTIAQMQADLTAVIGDSTVNPPIPGQEKTTLTAEATMNTAGATWDTGLNTLHRRTMQGVGMIKNRYKDDAVKLALVAHLTAAGDSMAGILSEALDLETAWTKTDATWSPVTTNTLATFSALRMQCLVTFQEDFKDKRSAWREQAGIEDQMFAALEATNVAWYTDALRVFPLGTPEGSMIRGTIPTTYVPRKAKKTATGTPPA